MYGPGGENSAGSCKLFHSKKENENNFQTGLVVVNVLDVMKHRWRMEVKQGAKCDIEPILLPPNFMMAN